MPSYKLTYFNGRGRAELTRWLFVVGGIEFEDVRLASEEWPKYKPNTPFGSLPVLEVDGKVSICQSNAIARFVAKQIGYAGKNDLEEARANMIVDCVEDFIKPILKIAFGPKDDKVEATEKFVNEELGKFLGYFEKFLKDNGTGFFVGNNFTYADFAVVLSLDWANMLSPVNLDKYPLLKKLKDNVVSQPKIAEWIKKRPESNF